MKKLTQTSAIVYKHLDTRTGRTPKEMYHLVLNDWGSVGEGTVFNILSRFVKEGLAIRKKDELDTKVSLYYKATPILGTEDQSFE